MNARPSRPRIDPAAVAAAAEIGVGLYGTRFSYSIGHAVIVRDFVDQAVALCGDTPVVIEVWERLSATNFRAVALDDTMNARLRGIAASAGERAEETCLWCGSLLVDLDQPRRKAPSWRHVECR
jgi:hypothetical protein